MPQGKGAHYEQLAKQYLQNKGLSFHSSNYRCRRGEIDLIMQHRDTLVFVEVRYRASSLYGSAAETVTPNKQRRVCLAAAHYLHANKLWHLASRFDVIAIDSDTRSADSLRIQWLPAAFEPA